MRKINKIIIHCSATFEEQDFDIEAIRKWHKDEGWSDVGYHYVIKLDGTVQKGRNLNTIGSHCKGENKHSIGICYIGGLVDGGFGNPEVTADTRTEKQKKSLIKKIKELKEAFPKATIHGHNEFSNKACPCFNVKEEYGTNGEKL